MKNRTTNILMLVAIVLLAVLPLIFVKGEFGGADDAAEKLIQSIQPSYQPWFSSFFELPAETESMLFALQAALGAGFIGYAFGLFKGKASKSKSQ
ncbi:MULTISPECIES: energy-coupling factor ABC transporter substrate-binding protein [Paenibacillus]|uniref:Cobalt transport protein CbiN n=2 Tax=Paenibacillus TaxID=44249 RepID=A0A1V4HAD5_9BACL|nr:MULTISPECIES: energy-coupling factor ABC transporter substrate-binding protein [Paenibacillus]MEC0225530.1 energy-coupling factor ABC transporter substrate-binding protein [Paenibacillus alba]NQX69589.1 energy-coupling factor ABC transporter substrate-binding protein [Paenibacillus alba]OPH48614.1 cobalt ABC transporter substrate-binding protein CbiN [Paenibacillus ferrarius]